MSNVAVDKALIGYIADAIRYKLDINDRLYISEMPERISEISGGGKTIASVSCSAKIGDGANDVYYGDVNGDGVVDEDDIALVSRYVVSPGSTVLPFPNAAKLSSDDDVIDINDQILLDRIVNRQAATIRITVTYTDNTSASFVRQVALPPTGSVDSSEATALASDILSGLTAVIDNEMVTGTMPDHSQNAIQPTNNSSVNVTTNSANGGTVRLSIPNAGYYNTNNMIKASYSAVATAIGLTSAKLVSGESVLGINGSGGGGGSGSGSSGRTVTSVECTTTTQAGNFIGDPNGDGYVNSSDQALLSNYISHLATISDTETVDLIVDGTINNSDLSRFGTLLSSMTSNQILAKVTVNYSDSTSESYIRPVNAPNRGLPSGVQAFSTGTYIPADNITSQIEISHNLGVVPDVSLFWCNSKSTATGANNVQWGGGVVALLACGYFNNLPGTGTRGFAVRQTTSGLSVVLTASSNASQSGMVTAPDSTKMYPKGYNGSPINSGGVYKWMAIKYS